MLLTCVYTTGSGNDVWSNALFEKAVYVQSVRSATPRYDDAVELLARELKASRGCLFNHPNAYNDKVFQSVYSERRSTRAEHVCLASRFIDRQGAATTQAEALSSLISRFWSCFLGGFTTAETEKHASVSIRGRYIIRSSNAVRHMYAPDRHSIIREACRFDKMTKILRWSQRHLNT